MPSKCFISILPDVESWAKRLKRFAVGVQKSRNAISRSTLKIADSRRVRYTSADTGGKKLSLTKHRHTKWALRIARQSAFAFAAESIVEVRPSLSADARSFSLLSPATRARFMAASFSPG